LRLHAEGRQATVTLSRNDSTVSKVNLTTLEFGGFFLSEARAAYRPRQFKLDFAFRLGLPKSESAYRLFSLSGNYHKLLTRFLETDVSGRVETASEDTPIFDQPSFGGSDVVRAFRRDDLIGLTLWSVQPELWFPVPGTIAAESGIKKFLQRQVRLAGFFDVGGVYRTATSKNGIKVGPGIGARLIFFPVIMKLDWAYGIGETVTGKGRGRFYFTVGTNLPF
jgi:outer membrane protein assembly factor BamA